MPDQDPSFLGLTDVAAFGKADAVVSGFTIQYSSDAGASFNISLGAPAGGEIARVVNAAGGAPTGFAIVGQTDDESVNGEEVEGKGVCGLVDWGQGEDAPFSQLSQCDSPPCYTLRASSPTWPMWLFTI